MSLLTLSRSLLTILRVLVALLVLECVLNRTCSRKNVFYPRSKSVLTRVQFPVALLALAVWMRGVAGGGGRIVI